MGIDFLDIIYRVEKSLDIRLARDDFDFTQKQFLVRDFYDLVERKVNLKEDGSSYTREEIEEIVKTAICEALAVKPGDVTPEKDLVRDLGME